MTSPKKKKGQQRKAAKNQAMANYGASSNRELAAKVETETKFVGEVGRAHDLETIGLSVDINDLNQSSTLTLSGMLGKVPGKIHKRALPHVLNFLRRCEDETFDQVMTSVGGDLVSPVTWIKVLIRTVQYEPSCSLQIAENIGPLASCMCKDTERLFFKSNKHWTEGIRSFVWLIRNMIQSSMVPNAYEGNKQVVDVLLQHNGLLTSIVQWSFWADYRPDLLEDLGSASCGVVVKFGRSITRLLVHSIAAVIKNVSTKGKTLLEDIGSTPIVSKSYDPTCMVSYVEGLIRQMKTDEWDRLDLQAYDALTIGVDGVDRGVITETIDLGLNFATTYKRAFSVAVVLQPMMRQGEQMNLKDTRVAFAIRAGLIEMYLSFIDRFWEHESFQKESSSLYSNIRHLLKDIHSISLHQKTAKAIRSKSGTIEEELARLQLQQNTSITNNIKCRELLDMISSILNLSGSYCCRCNKSLSKTEVLQCNGCHRMSYCSRTCQKDDWLNGGHNVTCCKTYNDVSAGQFQGMIQPEEVPDDERASGKLKELETNLNMKQLKLLADNSSTILSQARSLNISLYDCVVMFDLRACPPTIKVVKHTDWFSTPELMGKFEQTRSKENITFAYCTYFYDGKSEDRLVMQRFYPHEWLSKQSSQCSTS